jgi:hypothetical protein
MKLTTSLAATTLVSACALTSPNIIEPVNTTTLPDYFNYCEANYIGGKERGERCYVRVRECRESMRSLL